MKYLDLTLPTPQENLACDEALLDWCDDSDGPEVLRFWEPQQPFVVVGYSNKVEREVNPEACRELEIPILRRCSGGGTVLQGPGCLNYSLILKIDRDPALQTVTGTNRFVMERNRAALEKALSGGGGRKKDPPPGPRTPDPQSPIAVRGHTDLTIGDRKFSGNAQRRKRRAVLFHGTFLLNVDIVMIERTLRSPSKQPGYRANRSHSEFLTNLNIPADAVKTALRGVWRAAKVLEEFRTEQTRKRVEQKYSADGWNLNF
ncbi:MAG TPA: lipoate--protein ligase family protein [Verrucomicrobiae bacterium]|nr:lipoate--protein ligase family protein [Verrucomicrobiae bacterium]